MKEALVIAQENQTKLVASQTGCTPKVGNRFNTRQYKETLQFLMEKFPDAFVKTKDRILKVGIHKDIKEQTELTGVAIRGVLRKYCNSASYKKALFEGNLRFDLQGNIIGVVTAKEMGNQLAINGTVGNDANGAV